jgi:hypothetical protein
MLTLSPIWKFLEPDDIAIKLTITSGSQWLPGSRPNT